MESTNVNDLVGFCPHEDLSGQGNADKFCGFMVPGQFKMNFAGKRLTIEGAKITGGAVKSVNVKGAPKAKATPKVEVEPEPVVEEPQPTVAEEPVVAAPVDPVVEAPAEEAPVEEAPVEEAPVAEAPVKKRRSRKKA